jgi:MSHA pilin protein MshC
MRPRIAMTRPPGFPRDGLVPFCGPHPRGFTLVELIVVIAILAIISTIGMSRFASTAPFTARAAADELGSTLRAAQRIAVAQRRVVHVLVQADPVLVQLCRDAACTEPIAPTDGSSSWFNPGAGIVLSASASFSFDGMGRPSFGSALELIPSDGGSTLGPTVRVEPDTGLVRLVRP